MGSLPIVYKRTQCLPPALCVVLGQWFGSSDSLGPPDLFQQTARSLKHWQLLVANELVKGLRLRVPGSRLVQVRQKCLDDLARVAKAGGPVAEIATSLQSLRDRVAGWA